MIDLAPATCEVWLRRHRRGVLLALAVAAVTVRVGLVAQVAGGPLPRMHELVADSDNRFFDDWGRRIAGGDLLQRTPAHPMTEWMRLAAANAMSADPRLPLRLGLASDLRYDGDDMARRLWDHWLGGATFYQEPAYPYLVGLTYSVSGPDPWHVYAWQLALGVALVLLIHTVTRRIVSETAAAAAGVLAVLAPIPLVYEVTLLRDFLVAFATVALALAMHWAPAGGRRRWLILGFAFGAAMLVKQTFLLFPLGMGAWRLVSRRDRLPARLAAGGAVAAGMFLALLPAILRNWAVGAPALALTGAGDAMLAAYHAAGAGPFDLVIGPDFVTVLTRSDGHLLSSLLGAARTYDTPWGMGLLELKKVLYAWHGFESPNNVDFQVFRQGARILAFLPVTFVVVVPLAAIGLATRRAQAYWPLLVAAVPCVATMVLAAVFSRYRASLVAVMLPLAGAGCVRAAMWAHARRWGPLLAAAAATTAYVLWATSAPPGKAPAELARDYGERAASWRAAGELELAVFHLREALRLEPEDALTEARLGDLLLSLGRPAEALLQLDAAARKLDSRELRLLRARALVELGRTGEANAVIAPDPRPPP
jgi:hypothetical protein